MLLRFLRSPRLRAAASEDEGMALAAVMALVVVMLLISSAIAAATISAASFTTSTRADVQSQAAADSGIDAAYAAIRGGSDVCSATSITVPLYTVTVAYKNSSGTTLTCSGTVSGTPATAVVTSVGSAAANGLRATDGNTATVAANLTFASTTTTSTATGTGPAVYGYSMASGGLSGSGSVQAYNGSVPDVMVKTGDVSCSGAAAANAADLVVASGKLDLSGSCSIAGNVSSSGALTMNGATTVGGNASGSSVSVSGSSRINGDVTTAGAFSLMGSSRTGSTTANTVSAANATFGSSNVLGSMWITGATTLSQSTVGKNLTTKTLSNTGSTIGGTTNVVASGPGTSPYTSPPAPTVPNWFDYSYSASTWPGYTVVPISGATCGFDQLAAALATIGTGNGIIDARGCTGGVNPGDYQSLVFRGNLVIVANSFALGGSASFTSISGASKLWLITPDTTPGNTPTCLSGSSFTIGGSFTFGSNISTLIYTPCAVTIASSTTIYGQVWAGSFALTGAGSLYFSPVGLPGYDLAVGSTTTTTTTTTPTLNSRYDVAG